METLRGVWKQKGRVTLPLAITLKQSQNYFLNDSTIDKFKSLVPF